ncbi:MAG: type II toxin-antitoxin system VapC family toxin [Gemmataceae bacterium]|nr:type II toxin-antitoxin system VapC family toxin [Gemmataceae bacterium]
MRIYFDSAIVIYLIEQPTPFASAVNRFLQSVTAREYVCSEMTRAECMIAPRRAGNRILEIEFEWFFRQSFVRLLPLTRSIFDRTIELRANHRHLKTPDALHLATAIEAGCDGFRTNDARLSSLNDIPIHQI